MPAVLPNLSLIMQTGIDPRNLNASRALARITSPLKENIVKQLRINDEQVAVNRYVWRNLPKGLNSQLMERILYYRGRAAFFYSETADRFFFLPYALIQGLDVYGRYMKIEPVQMGGSELPSDGNFKKEKPWIPGLQLDVMYDVLLPEELTEESLTKSAVIINDYTPQYSQIIIPRYSLQAPILDVMADCIPFMRTALLKNTGISGMRVQSEDEQSNVSAAAAQMHDAALNGMPWQAIIGSVDFQELTGGASGKAEEYLLAMQGIDNFRMGLYGIDNGGLFQKKAHLLEQEASVNGGPTHLILQDGLEQRLQSADIINSIWGLGVYPEINVGVEQMMAGLEIDETMNEGGEEDAQYVGNTTLS